MQSQPRWPHAALMLLLLFLISCSKPSSEEATNSAGQRLPSESERTFAVAPVKVLEVQPGSLELSTQATGVLRSRYQVPLSAQVGGRVLNKLHEIGDALAAGDPIVQLDPEPFQLALQQAQAGEASAQVAYDQAVRNFERNKILRQTLDISEFELENAILAERTAQSSWQAAQAVLKLAERNLRLTQISSPVNGHLADLDVQIGQQVEPGAPFGLVVSLDRMEIEIALSEREIGSIRVGSEARIHCDALPGTEFHGKAMAVGVAGLEPGKTFPVIVAVENPDRRLKPGMSAMVDLIYAEPTGSICIPRDALVMADPNRPAVFVVQGEHALHRAVRLGEGNADHVIVETGLSPGDQLVIEGQSALHDSSHVRIL